MVILMALVSLGFAACSDDDEPKVADIVGTWQYDHPDDEDAVVAVLVATIEFHKEFGKDSEVISIKRIEE